MMNRKEGVKMEKEEKQSKGGAETDKKQEEDFRK